MTTRPDNRTTYPATRHGVTAALAALGGTVHDIAATLLAAGYRGHLGSGYRCPIANYLTDVVPDADADLYGIEVGDDGVMLTSRSDGFLRVMPPAPIGEFIDAFDGGRFPALVSDPNVCTCDACTD